MSTSPVVPAAGTPAAAPKLNAIQRIEQELIAFFRQKEQAVANVHAIDGAIQAAQHLIGVLKAEEAKAAAEAEKLAGEVVAGVKEAVAAVEAEAKKL